MHVFWPVHVMVSVPPESTSPVNVPDTLKRHRFPDMSEGADTVFVWGLQDAEILAHSRTDFYVGLVHPANTSPKRTQDPAWHPVPVQTIDRLLEADHSFYQGLAGVDLGESL